MPNKSLRFLILVCGFLLFPFVLHAEGVSIFDHQLLGKCFSSVGEFTSTAFGEASNSDPNIEVQTSRVKGEPVTWVIDKTSTTNYQWYLLGKSERDVCLRLYVPVASLVDELPVQKGNKPGTLRMRAFISPGPSFPAKKIIFIYSDQRKIFKPEKCTETNLGDKGEIKYSRQISCERILD